MAKQLSNTESVGKGQTIRTETSPDRSDVKPSKETLTGGSFKGGVSNIGHSISDGKVPRD